MSRSDWGLGLRGPPDPVPERPWQQVRCHPHHHHRKPLSQRRKRDVPANKMSAAAPATKSPPSLAEMSNLRPLTMKDSRFNKKSHSSGPWHQFCKPSKNISPTVVVVTHPRRCAHLFLPAHYPLVSEGQMAAEEKKANWGPSWRLPLDPDEA